MPSRSFTRSLAAVAFATAAVLAGGLSAQDTKVQEDRPENYPDGPHRETTYYFCTACHGFKLVAQQGMTADQWHETLDWMQEKHALPVTQGKQRDELIEYLATAFPQRTKPGWKNPFAR